MTRKHITAATAARQYTLDDIITAANDLIAEQVVSNSDMDALIGRLVVTGKAKGGKHALRSDSDFLTASGNVQNMTERHYAEHMDIDDTAGSRKNSRLRTHLLVDHQYSESSEGMKLTADDMRRDHAEMHNDSLRCAECSALLDETRVDTCKRCVRLGA